MKALKSPAANWAPLSVMMRGRKAGMCFASRLQVDCSSGFLQGWTNVPGEDGPGQPSGTGQM
jgi:hypothetical protein